MLQTGGIGSAKMESFYTITNSDATYEQQQTRSVFGSPADEQSSVKFAHQLKLAAPFRMQLNVSSKMLVQD